MTQPTPSQQRLLDAGRTIVAARHSTGDSSSPFGLTPAEVASEAGVARTGFYALWPDRDGTRRSFDRYLDHLEAELSKPRFDHRDLALAALAGPGGWPEALDRLVAVVVNAAWGAGPGGWPEALDRLVAAVNAAWGADGMRFASVSALRAAQHRSSDHAAHELAELERALQLTAESRTGCLPLVDAGLALRTSSWR